MRAASLVLFVLLSMVVVSGASVPQTMSYQGVLRDASGNVVPDGIYSVVFSLYTGAVGGSAIWTETQSVSTHDGIFNVILGSVALTPVFDAQYWLGIAVEGEAELTPRVALTSAPYAFRAKYADVADDGDWSVNGNTGANSGEGIYLSDENGDLAGIVAYDNDSSYPNGMRIMNNRPGGSIQIGTAGLERVRVDNAGYVGIGTSSPAARLDVAGDVRTQGFMMPTGASDGYVLTSNGTGTGTWQSPPGGGGLTLPYEGSASDTGTVFTVTNTSTGPAIRGFGMWPYNQTFGQLGDSFYGVLGEDMDTGNFGYLGHNNNGVYGKVYSLTGQGVRGVDNATGHYGYLGSATHGGYFSGNVSVRNGNLGVGMDSPAVALDVVGPAAFMTSNATTTASMTNTYDGTLGQTVQIERTVMPSNGNDLLAIDVPAGTPTNFQYIECAQDGVVDFSVGADGYLYAANGGEFDDGLTINDGSIYAECTQWRCGYFASDYPSGSTYVLNGEYTGTGYYDATGVYGNSTPQDNFGYGGYFEGGYVGAYGRCTATGSAASYRGVAGYATGGTGTNTGVYGYASASGGSARGIYATAVGTGTLYAAYLNGNVTVVGTLSKGGGSFKIDHPLDPANKYLYHSFVESPDMMNIYNGNVELDAKGEALVEMPDWFEALNRDFRYQLTPIGAPGPNLYIAKEIENGAFEIAGGTPGAKVSWQVTGIRHDAFAEANRIPVEEEKPAAERGKYLYPAALGMPATLGVSYEEPERERPVTEAPEHERHAQRIDLNDGE